MTYRFKKKSHPMASCSHTITILLDVGLSFICLYLTDVFSVKRTLFHMFYDDIKITFFHMLSYHTKTNSNIFDQKCDIFLRFVPSKFIER